VAYDGLLGQLPPRLLVVPILGDSKKKRKFHENGKMHPQIPWKFDEIGGLSEILFMKFRTLKPLDQFASKKCTSSDKS